MYMVAVTHMWWLYRYIFNICVCVTLHLAYGEFYTVDLNLYIIEIVQIDNMYTQKNTKASYN